MSISRCLCHIQIQTEKGFEERFFLGDRFTVGRSPDVDIQIASNEISREHIRVEIDGRDLYIVDCGSSNGTFVDGAGLEPLAKTKVLPHQRIELGNKGLTITLTLFRRPVDPKIESDELLKEAIQEADVIRRDAEARAKTILDEVKAQTEQKAEVYLSKARQKLNEAERLASDRASSALKKAQEEAGRILSQAGHEAEEKARKIIEEGQRKRQEAIDAIQGDLKKLKEEAHAAAAGEIADLKEQAKAEFLLRRAEGEQAARQLESEARARIEDKVTKAQAEAELILKDARRKSSEVLEQAEAEGQRKLDAAEKKADEWVRRKKIDYDQVIQEGKEQNLRFRKEAEADIQEIRVKAMREAEEIRTKGEKRAEDEAQKVRQLAEEQAAKLLDRAKAESEDFLEKARKSADSIRERADATAEEIRAQARSQSAEVILAAKEENLKLKKINDELDQRRVQLEGEIAARNEELAKAEKEKAGVISALEEARSAAAEAVTTRKEREHELTEVLKSADKQRSQIESEIKNQKNSLEAARNELASVHTQHQDVEKKIRSAQENIQTLKTQAEKIEREIAQLEFRKKKSEEEVTQVLLQRDEIIQKTREEAQEIESAAQAEAAAQRQKAAETLQELKHQQELELAQMRLHQAGESARLWQEYEARLEENKSKIISSLVQDFEKIMIFHIKKGTSPESSWPPPELEGEIRESVERVIQSKLAEDAAASEGAEAFPTPVPTVSLRTFWIRAATVGLAMSLIFSTAGIFIDRQFRMDPNREISSLEGKTATEIYANKIKKERTAGTEFAPEMDRTIKTSYTDNALYTINYLQAKLDQKVQDQWILNLDQFVREDLELNEEAIVLLIAVEARLLNQMKSLRERINGRFLEAGIQRLRDAEIEAQSEMEKILGSEAYYDRFLKFEQAFIKDILATYEPAE